MKEDSETLLSASDFQLLFAARNRAPLIAPIDFQLLPYVLAPNHIVQTPYELPAACDADWDRAAQHLVKGYFTEWLRASIAPLRARYQHGPADELEAMANRANELAHNVTVSDAFSRNAALEIFLLSLGAAQSVPEFSTEQINFSPIGVESPCAEIALIVTNAGRGFLFGEIFNQAPWLEVKTKRFGCFRGESYAIRVQPHLENMPAGQHGQPDAILVKSSYGDQKIGANIQILPAILQLDPDKLDFGTIGIGDDASVQVRLWNRGAGYMSGSVESRVPWARLSPRFWRIGAGKETIITVEADTFALPSGNTQQKNSIVIESNGGRAELDLSIQIAPPHLKIEPTRLEMRAVDMAIVESDHLPSTEVKITNEGAGLLIGKLVPDEDWLIVEPTEFRCRRGEVQKIQITAKHLKVGKHVQAIRIHSNAIASLLPVWLDIVFSLKPATVRIPSERFLRGSLSRQQLAERGCADPLAELGLGMGRRRVVIDATEQPQIDILLSEYWIGKYPVTNAEYQVYIHATGHRPPEHWNGTDLPTGTEYEPVTNITWHQARMYCNWLSEVSGKLYDLPTEAQWEKAARGTDGRIFPWGNNWDRQVCNTIENGRRRPNGVGAFSPVGDSPYACSDMAGNVWEWVLDWFGKDYYAQSDVEENPLGPANGRVKVIRGGSYRADAMQARCANRSFASPNNANAEMGFRVAMKSEA